MELLTRLLIIGCGGFIGSALRYLMSTWVQQRSGSFLFPFGTFSVNMMGCFFIGLLSYLVEMRSMFSPELRSFLLVGLLGGFTTFSTFGNETLNLIRDGRFDLAGLNAAGQLIVGLFMVWLGRAGAGLLWR